MFERRKVDALGSRARAELGGLNAFVVDSVQGMGELIAFRAIAARRQLFHDQTAEYQRTRVALNADLSFQTAKQEVVSALGSTAVLVTAAFMIHSHAFEPTLLPLVALLSSAAFLPVTSHLDAAGEARVRAALDELMVDRTTLIIAHRLSTIRAADQILVMRDGRIVERGKHRDLMSLGGFYAELIGHQSAGAAPAGLRMLAGR
ncbi:hypothetical protein ACQZ4X_26450 [Agrobacterium vitis]